MAEKKAKRPIHRSPEGIASFPYLNKADTKFDPEGVFQVKLILEGETAEKFQVWVDKKHDEGVEIIKKEKKLKNPKRADPPYEMETDDDGNETGRLIFKFKLNQIGKNGDKTWTQRPALFDAKGKPITDTIYSGSKLKVAFEVSPYYTKLVGAGITLRMKAVQVLELAEYNGDRDAASYGFEEEEGWESDGADSAPFNDDDDAGYDGDTDGGSEEDDEF